MALIIIFGIVGFITIMYFVGWYSLEFKFRKRLPIKNNIVEMIVSGSIVYTIALFLLITLIIISVSFLSWIFI